MNYEHYEIADMHRAYIARNASIIEKWNSNVRSGKGVLTHLLKSAHRNEREINAETQVNAIIKFFDKKVYLGPTKHSGPDYGMKNIYFIPADRPLVFTIDEHGVPRTILSEDMKYIGHDTNITYFDFAKKIMRGGSHA